GVAPQPPGPANWSSVARRWNFTDAPSRVTFTLKHAAGDVMNFEPWDPWNYDPAYPSDNYSRCTVAYGYKPTTWAFPQGPTLTFNYDPSKQFDAMISVTSSLGRSLTFSADSSVHRVSANTSPALTAGETAPSTTITASIEDAAHDTWTFSLTDPDSENSP